MIHYDKIILGAGIYGLYAAIYTAKKNTNQKVLIIEKEKQAFTRATYINQARVHMGYHYPRSYSTAIKSANYFEKFINQYPDSILESFEQIYATSSKFSWTNAIQFEKFCRNANIDCEKVDVDKYFKKNMCDGAFLTKEYTYDAKILQKIMLSDIEKSSNIDILFETDIKDIQKMGNQYILDTNKGIFQTEFILNCTYASINQILKKLDYELFQIKYELCEIIICSVSKELVNTGITVMDGPFFSIMPFGKSGYHSLTSVTFTPHIVSYDELPTFSCQQKSNGYCTPTALGNCNNCLARPQSAWMYMSNLAKKYLQDKYEFQYEYSLFSMKPILIASEIDDSRPTVIKQYSSNPYFYSVLSGKINTIYDLEEIL